MQISQMNDIQNSYANVKFPLYVTDKDYHTFKHLAEILSEVTGKKVQYEELGCDGEYHGILFLPEQKAVIDTSYAMNEIKRSFD